MPSLNEFATMRSRAHIAEQTRDGLLEKLETLRAEHRVAVAALERIAVGCDFPGDGAGVPMGRMEMARVAHRALARTKVASDVED